MKEKVLPSFPRSSSTVCFIYTANERWDRIKDARVKIMLAQIGGGENVILCV